MTSDLRVCLRRVFTGLRLSCRLGLTSSPEIVGRDLRIGKKEFPSQHCYGGHSWGKRHKEHWPWIFLSGQAAIMLGLNASPAFAEDVSVEPSSENDVSRTNIAGLRRIEDGSVISNEHTSKWRVFTDCGRDLFLQGKLDEAEKMFLCALQEAKIGFGERDAHVASACNNLAELYRVKKSFEKAEPLYLDAIKILKDSFGPEDVRVGVAFHNLGQFYLVQRKLEEACKCYEHALKIKRRVLGHGHTDYADTMYHLGTVLHLQAKDKDAETLIQESIEILEEAGQGESITCLRRLRFLAQMYAKSGRLAEAENIQRKILHLMELSKGWNSLDTVTAAESLALAIQSVGKLTEARELLERCLEARKTLLPREHVQVAANMLHIARVEMLHCCELRKTSTSEAFAELDTAKGHLGNAIGIAKQVLYKSKKQDGQQSYGVARRIIKDEHVALVILLQSLNALAQLEITKQELQQLGGEHSPVHEAENALRQCISAFKEFVTERLMPSSPDVKFGYLSCLKHLSGLLGDSTTHTSRRAELQELKDEIKRVEGEHSVKQRRKT